MMVSLGWGLVFKFINVLLVAVFMMVCCVRFLKLKEQDQRRMWREPFPVNWLLELL